MNNKHLQKIEELLEILVKLNIGPIMQKELSKPKMKQLYGMTGELGVKEISKRLGFSTGKISLIWQEWERIGLLRKDGKSYKKVVD